jgi:hypothetical protein
MASNLPSGYRGSRPPKEDEEKKEGSYLQRVSLPSIQADNSTFIAVIALILAVVSLFISVSSGGFSQADKDDLRAIASDLREIQQKEIVLTSPLKAKVVVDESFPITDILPENFKLYINEEVPVDSQLVGRSSTGQIVTFNVVDKLPIKAEVPIDTKRSLAGVDVNINKEIPIDTQFSVTMKVNAVYGKELNDIINRLEKISGQQ